MGHNTIKQMNCRRVWDSRGHPTIEVDVVLEGGGLGRAIAPAGASRGRREALDLRDGGGKFKGLDVQKARESVTHKIAPALIGRDIFDQEGLDARIIELDGTDTMSSLGGNATIATSLALLHAAAAARGKPLWRHISELYDTRPLIPLPEIQIFGGGAHAGNRVDIQDFMIMVPGAASFKESLEITAEIYHAAGNIMAARGKLRGVADEGGWWPVFDSNEEVLETLVIAIEKAGQVPGENVVISLDIAASEFCQNGGYRMALDEQLLDSSGVISLLAGWLDRYPIASIEDPLSEDDKEGMSAFTELHGDRVQIVGDDYLVTNPKLVKKAIEENICNAVLVKVNQIGTVTEAVKVCKLALNAGWRPIISARSGETEDLSIVHLAVGLGAGQLKVGSFSRSERMAKWNECLRIEEYLGTNAPFAGGAPLANTWWGGVSSTIVK